MPRLHAASLFTLISAVVPVSGAEPDAIIYLKVPVSVRVEWRHKEGAAFPGETALLEWKP